MSEGDEFEIDPRAFLASTDEEPLETGDQESTRTSSADGIASLQRIEQELADVEAALTRLDDGRYGVCDTCGAEISDVRLAEHPAEQRCAEHRTTGGSVGDR